MTKSDGEGEVKTDELQSEWWAQGQSDDEILDTLRAIIDSN